MTGVEWIDGDSADWSDQGAPASPVHSKPIKVGRPAKLTDEQRAEVVRRHDTGVRPSVLAKMFGVTPSDIHYYVHTAKRSN